MAVLLAAAIVARVSLLNAAIDHLLAVHGFVDARYRIASVGIRAVRVVDIRMGRELTVDELTVRYHAAQLLSLDVGEVVVSGLHLDLTGEEPGPLADLLVGPSGEEGAPPPRVPRLQITHGTARLQDNMEITLEAATVDPALDGTGYSLSAARLEGARGTLRVAASGLTATVDMAGGSAAPAAHFALTSLALHGDGPLVAPVALAGSMEKQASVWSLTATATAAHASKIHLEGSYSAADGALRGRLTVPALRFVPEGLQPGDLVPVLGAMQSVTGTVAGRISVRGQSGRPLVSEGDLRIDDLSFETAGLPIEGLVARATLAGDGASAEPVLRIDDLHIGLAGGRIAAGGVLFRPRAELNRFLLEMGDLDLSLLLAALDLKGVSGEGKFAGALPLLVTRDDIAVESGRLESQRPGILRIASPETAAALAQGGADTNLLLQALADFRYERLAFILDKPLSGESRLTLNMLGHNPAVLDGHPFQINVTVTTNLDKIFDLVTQGGRLSQDVIRAMVGASR